MKSFDWTILIKESFVSNAISIIKYLIMFPISGTRGQKGKIAESWRAEYKTTKQKTELVTQIHSNI